jgi:hypothetical protein
MAAPSITLKILCLEKLSFQRPGGGEIWKEKQDFSPLSYA